VNFLHTRPAFLKFVLKWHEQYPNEQGSIKRFIEVWKMTEDKNRALVFSMMMQIQEEERVATI
jgi:hypothetical protein